MGDVRLHDASIALPQRYKVLRRIASGGMATVYEAEDGVLGRLVAVKLLAPHVAADETARRRFEREARTAARVSDHPNVATIYDIGEHEENAFIVMELFSGGTVADRLREATTVPRAQALDWLGQAAAALDYAHSRDLIHRDVKPANLLLDERGRLAVADFGIARLVDDSSLTQAGQVLGTAAYLSPEQATGEGATAASDRYALGVVAYEMLTGRRPFGGEHPAAQARQHVESPTPESGISPAIDEVLGRAMAKDPHERYPTAARFVEELRHAVERSGADTPTEPTRAAAAAPPAAQPTSRRMAPVGAGAGRPDDTGSPPSRAAARGRGSRNGWLALAALAAVVLVVALVALLGGSGGEEQPTADRQTQEQQQSEPAQSQEPAPAEETPAAPQGEGEGGAGPDTAGAESPGELADAGYQRLQSGDAEGAIPLLQRAVDGYESQGDAADQIPYGYALYNLGEALYAAGRYDEAVSAYERRLEVSPNDQRKTVEQALKRAKKAAKG